MIKRLPCCLFIFLALLLALPSPAQSRRKKVKQIFGAGALIGLNAAQIDGDNVRGYKQKGIYGGLRGMVRFSERNHLLIELVYSQKGSRWEPGDGAFETRTKGELIADYVEIPILFRRIFGEKENFWWEAGFSFGRKIKDELKQQFNTPESTAVFNRITPNLKSSEFNMTLGIGHRFGKKIGVGLRSTWALTSMYEIDRETLTALSQQDPDLIVELRNYLLTLYTYYEF